MSTTAIGVYWNQDCTTPVTAIKWGTLSPGENKNITLYVRNEFNEIVTLIINTTEWKPEKASEFVTFSWTTTSYILEPLEVAKVTLTLSVKQNIVNIKEFSFDITFEGKTKCFLPTDLNKDGKVDMLDIAIVLAAYGSKPGDANWNEIADIDKNGCVDLIDVMMVVNDYGKTC